MRVSFQYFSSRFLIAVATGALLVLLIVVVTGGFALHAGPLRFSAHRWSGPLFIAVAAWLGTAFLGREHLRHAMSAVTRFLYRSATAIAVVLAAALASVGVAHGTFSASSADAAGYVSQAYLLSSGHLLRDEPLALEAGWPDAEWTFSPLGYRPGVNPGEIVPTYPPGLPVVMAAARVAAGDAAPFGVSPTLGAVAVLCTFALGTLLYSRVAGLVAAALLTTSPIVLFQVVQPMSDVPVTAWWALAWLLALAPLPQAPLAAGATAGIAILTRPNLAPLALVVALALALARPSSGRTLRTCWLPFAAGLLPAAGALCLVNWRLYGNPFASGYGEVSDLFSFDAILPNAQAYAMRVVQGELPALVLATSALVVVVIFRLKPEATGASEATAALEATAAPEATRTRSVRDAVLLAAAASVILLACYLPYGVFTEWSYLRFLLPVFPLAFVVVGAVVARAAAYIPEPVRGITLLVTLTVVGSVNVVHASREQAFNLRLFEARYRTAGRYLAAALPRNAAIIAAQQSASTHHYTGLPVVRWDLLSIDLDDAVERLRDMGRHPLVSIEDWEMARLRAKFPRSRYARLDWTPRADFGQVTRVRLFDPSDRDAPGTWPTDRIP
jgi:hypothetical protein